MSDQKSNQNNARYYIPRFSSLRRLWLAGQVVFFVSMMATFVVNSVKSTYVVAALIALPWVAGTWVPFTLISQDIRRAHDGTLGIAGMSESKDLAASVVGIHNTAICAPQIIAALASGLVFHLFRSQVEVPGQGMEVWLLRAGGLSAFAAIWFIRKIPEENQFYDSQRESP